MMYPSKPSSTNKSKSQLHYHLHSNLHSLTPKVINKKKETLVDKIVQLLKKKYKKFINMTNETLVKEVNSLLTNDILLNFDFNRFMHLIENHFNFRDGGSDLFVENTKDISNRKSINLTESSNNNDYLNLEAVDSKIENKIDSPSTSPKNFNPLPSPYDKKTKLEELKNIKEKDNWALLAKQDYEKFLDEKRNLKKIDDKKKKEVKDFLSQQIEEKNTALKRKKENDTKFEISAKNDYDNWKLKEEIKKNEKEQKIKQMIKMRDNLVKYKKQLQIEEVKKLKQKEKEILDKIAVESNREKIELLKRRELESVYLKEQMRSISQRAVDKKLNYQKEKEMDRKSLEEFDLIMGKLDKDRLNYRNAIKERMRVQENRQRLINNVKEAENGAMREMEQKFLKERDELDNRNRMIESLNLSRKKVLMEDVKKSILEQQREKIQRDHQMNEQDREYDLNVINSYNDFIKENREKEMKRKNNILRYKEDLDKQIFEKSEKLRNSININNI